MTGEFERRSILFTCLSVAIVFVLSLLLAAAVSWIYVSYLDVSVPSRVVAGFTEPLTTKLVPAIVVVSLHKWKSIPSTHLLSHPYRFGFVGGLSLGVFERVIYIVNMGAQISPGFLLVLLMHALNAMIIAGVIFSYAENMTSPRFFGKLIVAIMAAMFIHLLWNTIGVVIVA